MGITHHSNYVRWMEEARIAFLDHLGHGYAQLEAEGLASPVLAVECQYKRPTTFNDEIKIVVSVEKYNGIRITFRYGIMKNDTDELVAIGKTEHCFLDKTGRPIVAKKRLPKLDLLIKEFIK